MIVPRVENVDAPHNDRRRRRLGRVVAITGVLVMVVPAGWCVLCAYWSFTGCFMTCGPGDPLVGTFWGGVAVVLLGAPVLGGRMIARRPRRPRGSDEGASP